jgi:predicted esterase
MTNPTIGGPRLESSAARGELRGIALFCHGGTATSVEPPRDAALSLVRMRAFEQFVRAGTADRGISTSLLRYRVRGWNGAAADAFTDVRWAIEQLRGEYGTEVPIVLVGHSMGGRAALRAGGDPQVAAVCALAPWTPPGEPVGHLRDRTVAILHGRSDRWVPAKLSADFALRARAAGVPVARFVTPGGHSMVRGALRWHRFARDVVLGGTGIEPMRADIANALRRPVPEGLAVPL